MGVALKGGKDHHYGQWHERRLHIPRLNPPMAHLECQLATELRSAKHTLSFL
jgi:hypothetical protein